MEYLVRGLWLKVEAPLKSADKFTSFLCSGWTINYCGLSATIVVRKRIWLTTEWRSTELMWLKLVILNADKEFRMKKV